MNTREPDEIPTGPGSTALPELPELPADSEITWASLAHLGGVAGVVPALVIWLVYGKRSSFVESQAREAINFQLTGLVAWVALFIVTSLAVVAWRDFAVFVAPVLYFALWATLATFSILGFLTVKLGRPYRYRGAFRPLT